MIEVKLITTLEKIQNKLNKNAELIDYQNLLKTIKEKDYKKIVIPELGNRHVINLSNIIAIEADGSYNKLYLKEKKIITTSKNLKYFEEILPKDLSFFRSHRAWIINLNYIEFLNKSKLNIILANGTITAKVSRVKINDLFF